jgi:fumarate hydratase subunit alpha
MSTADPNLLDAVTKATSRAIFEAEIFLPDDVRSVLDQAALKETDPVAQGEFSNILANIDQAKALRVPICQDTGVHVIYVTLPPEIPLTSDLLNAISDGVRLATMEVPLRPNVVSPLSRKNTDDNTGPGMPAIHVRPGAFLSITAMPKGAGSENMSRAAMLLPSKTEDIRRFVVETMVIAGGKPCPPVILGVGIGGTFDGVAALAKEALLLPVDRMDPFEQELCNMVNDLGIGPMGLGGDTTALAVKVKTASCHTASLPVAVNVQCWACRRATVEVQW